MPDEVISRSVLPIPEPPHVGLTTYDAKDPDTHVPADRTAASPGRGAECAHRAAR